MRQCKKQAQISMKHHVDKRALNKVQITEFFFLNKAILINKIKLPCKKYTKLYTILTEIEKYKCKNCLECANYINKNALMFKYTKYKQHIDTAVQQNALNKIHNRSCAELVHKLYDVHATRGSRSVRSQGANSVQIVSSFNLHFSSADRVPRVRVKFQWPSSRQKKFVAVGIAANPPLVHYSISGV